jgi:hypothetical protein
MIGDVQSRVKAHLSDGSAIESQLDSFLGFVGILAIWHIIRLVVKLKAFDRWFSVGYLGWWTFTLIWNSIAYFILRGDHRLMLIFSIPAVLNLACIWYLTRRSFRGFAAQFAAEREKANRSRLMQKIAQKRMKDEIRSMRS